MGLRWALQAMAWVLLAGWFGSFAFFAFVLAPTAFEVLPSQEAAGALVAPVLAILHNYGIVAGLSLAILGAALRRGWISIALPLALAATCALSEYGVTPRINEVEPHAFGESQEKEAAVSFSQLHQTSRHLFGITMLGTLGLIVVQARPRPPQAPSRSGRSPQAPA